MREKQKQKWNNLLVISAGTIGLLVVFYLLKLNFGSYIDQVFDALKSVFIPAAIALFVVYLVAPLNRAFKKRGLNKNLSALLTIIVFFLMVLAFLGLISFLLAQQVINIIPMVRDNWNEILATIGNITGQVPDIDIITDQNTIDWAEVSKLLFGGDDSGSLVFSATINGLNRAIYWLIAIIMMPVFLFFFLREGENIFSGFIKVIPKKFYRDDLETIMKFANSSTEKYIRGKLISIFFLFLFFSLGFTITLIVLGEIPVMTAILYGLLFGAIIALLDLIPYIGPAIGIILPIFFVFILAESTIQFLIFAGILIIIDIIGQNLQKILIEPIIMSKEVDVHPLAVFAGLLFFGALFGFVGLILATPIVATTRSVYNYLIGKYSEEEIEVIIDEDINNDSKIG